MSDDLTERVEALRAARARHAKASADAKAKSVEAEAAHAAAVEAMFALDDARRRFIEAVERDPSEDET